MILKAIVDDQVYTLNVPDSVLRQGAGFFDQLDRDMDRGWQMSREWVDQPDRLQRCQIVADKLLTALEKQNEHLGMLTAGYILARLPDVDAVELDIQGEIQNNRFRFRDASTTSSTSGPAAPPPAAAAPIDPTPVPTPMPTPMPTPVPTAGPTTAALGKLSKLEAMAQAGQDVTKVFKVGKAWRFSVFDRADERWQDSPLIATEQEAERLRQAAVKARYEALVGTPSGTGV